MPSNTPLSYSRGSPGQEGAQAPSARGTLRRRTWTCARRWRSSPSAGSPWAESFAGCSASQNAMSTADISAFAPTAFPRPGPSPLRVPPRAGRRRWQRHRRTIITTTARRSRPKGQRYAEPVAFAAVKKARVAPKRGSQGSGARAVAQSAVLQQLPIRRPDSQQRSADVLASRGCGRRRAY